MEDAHSIELDLVQKLRDPEYRKRFFLAEASARIAEQIIALRKLRGLTQTDLAARAGTKQPAISRAEQADYQKWHFDTLRAIADALDARLRVLIEPAEEVIWQYDEPEVLPEQDGGDDFSPTRSRGNSLGPLDDPTAGSNRREREGDMTQFGEVAP